MVRVVTELGHLAADLMETIHAHVHGIPIGNLTIADDHVRQKLKLLRYRYRQLAAAFGEPEEDPPPQPGLSYELARGSLSSVRLIGDPEGKEDEGSE